jgi:CDP-diacylglycerol---glycerol-3-phosphate 3-phosphatidyltransferase
MNADISAKKSAGVKLPEARKALGRYFTQPIVRLLAKTSLTPNALTWIGFLITDGAAALVVAGQVLAAGLVVLVAGLFDMLAGGLARATNRTSAFGAVLDSTLDRLSEAIVLIGILFYFILTGNGQPMLMAILVSIALLGSFLVSYTRSRAETLGLDCQLGIGTRPERVIIIALGLSLNFIPFALIIALGLISIFSWITVGQRLNYVWQKTRKPD